MIQKTLPQRQSWQQALFDIYDPYKKDDESLQEEEQYQPPYDCKINYDCELSKCCSQSRCQKPFVCISGMKIQNDYCDYNYECMSRCCNQERNICNNQRDCYFQCQTNQDCEQNFGKASQNDREPCCSQQHCTNFQVCKGNKAFGDYCDRNSECLTNFCKNHLCDQVSEQDQKNYYIDLVIRIVAILIIIIAILLWMQGRSNNQVQNQRNHSRGQNRKGNQSPDDIKSEEDTHSQRSKTRIHQQPINPIQDIINSRSGRGLQFNKKKASRKASLSSDDQGQNNGGKLNERLQDRQIRKMDVNFINLGAQLHNIEENSLEDSHTTSKVHSNRNSSQSSQNSSEYLPNMADSGDNTSSSPSPRYERRPKYTQIQ